MISIWWLSPKIGLYASLILVTLRVKLGVHSNLYKKKLLTCSHSVCDPEITFSFRLD